MANVSRLDCIFFYMGIENPRRERHEGEEGAENGTVLVTVCPCLLSVRPALVAGSSRSAESARDGFKFLAAGTRIERRGSPLSESQPPSQHPPKSAARSRGGRPVPPPGWYRPPRPGRDQSLQMASTLIRLQVESEEQNPGPNAAKAGAGPTDHPGPGARVGPARPGPEQTAGIGTGPGSRPRRTPGPAAV